MSSSITAYIYKNIATIVTLSRIAGAFSLFLTDPFSVAFYIIYCYCFLSDAVDGTIARKTKTESKSGEILDTIADVIFVCVVLIILRSYLTQELWMTYWICVIILLHIITLVIGLMKYKKFAFLHTYGNKATGGVIYCFPLLLHTIGLTAAMIVIYFVASISALEGLVIIARSKYLNRNTTSLFQNSLDIESN